MARPSTHCSRTVSSRLCLKRARREGPTSRNWNRVRACGHWLQTAPKHLRGGAARSTGQHGRAFVERDVGGFVPSAHCLRPMPPGGSEKSPFADPPPLAAVVKRSTLVAVETTVPVERRLAEGNAGKRLSCEPPFVLLSNQSRCCCRSARGLVSLALELHLRSWFPTINEFHRQFSHGRASGCCPLLPQQQQQQPN